MHACAVQQVPTYSAAGLGRSEEFASNDCSGTSTLERLPRNALISTDAQVSFVWTVLLADNTVLFLMLISTHMGRPCRARKSSHRKSIAKINKVNISLLLVVYLNLESCL